MQQLTSLKESSIKIYNIYSFDCETYSDNNYFYMCSIRGNNFIRVFFNKEKTIECFLNLIDSKNIIFTTNLQFDIMALFEDTKYLRYIEPILRGSDFIAVWFHNPNKENEKLLFLDTYNFARFSLDTLGKIINIPKFKKPKCIGKIPKNNKELHELINYNLQDSLVTLKFAEFLQDSFLKLGTDIKFTIASTSMSLFRRKYLLLSINQPSKKEINFFKEGYYGGRTEAFKKGIYKGKFFYYDFNSLYPSTYINLFPNPNSITKIKNKSIDNIKYEGISYVEIESPNIEIPLLPFRNDNKKLIFPIGKWKGYYTHLELRKAKKLKYKIKIINGYIFTNTFNIFKNYGLDLYNLRMKYKKENNPYELPVKIALNSLYGKFAQKYMITELKWLCNVSDKEMNEMLKKGYELDIVKNVLYITKESDKLAPFINPIFSAYITSYGRLKLYEFFEKIGFNNIYYCDTDSILTDKEIKTSDELGDLKIEHIIKECVIIKPKMYGFINDKNEFRVKCKGIPSFLFKSYEDFLKFLENPEIDFIKFCKFKESLRSIKNYKPNQKIKVNKKLLLQDEKKNLVK